MQLVFVRLAASGPPTPSRRAVNMSSRPSRRLAAIVLAYRPLLTRDE